MTMMYETFHHTLQKEDKAEEYHDALDENDRAKLIELFPGNGHNDAQVVYARDYSTWTQESFFEAGVKKRGGGFVTQLLYLYQKADPINRRKIREMWPEIWISYVSMGITIKQEREQSEA